jgi:hypothetical protein
MRALNRSVVALSVALVTGAVNLSFAPSASAQTQITAPAESGLDVTDRSRSDYDAKGLPLGGFRAFPTLNVKGNYDDNIYRLSTGTTSDWFFSVAPSLLVKSEWSRHSLQFNGGLEQLKYMDQTSEDVLNWNAGANGQLDVLRELYLAGNVDYAQRHEPRSSPNDSFGVEPTPYKDLNTGASLHFKPNRFGVVIGGNFERLDYDPVARFPTGVNPNDDRDRDLYTGTVRLSYDFSPGYAAFAEASYNSRHFDQTFDRSGLRRDSNGYRVDGGLQFMLSHLLEGEVFVGYLNRKYKAPLSGVSGVDYGANLTWYATPLTTVHLTGARTVDDTTLAGASSEDRRSIAASVDHELTRNIILHANIGYANSEYPGITREDDTFDAGVGAEYLLNRYLSLNVNYSYEDKSSNAAGAPYSDNLISFGLKAQL